MNALTPGHLAIIAVLVIVLFGVAIACGVLFWINRPAPEQKQVISEAPRAGIRINVLSPGVVPTPAYDLLGLKGDQLDGFIEMRSQLGFSAFSPPVATYLMSA